MKPVTAPIIGATKITHLENAIGALSIKLTQEEVVYLEEPSCRIPSSVISEEVDRSMSDKPTHGRFVAHSPRSVGQALVLFELSRSLPRIDCV